MGLGPMDAETELLLACARTLLDADRSRRIAELVAQGPDWQRLLNVAQVQGVLPLLHRSLDEACPDALPGFVRARLQAACRGISAACVRLTGELLRLLDLFAEHRIRAVPYKGPALAAAVYGNIALRQFGDLDFLLPTEDVFAARDLLLALDYRSLFGLTYEQEGVYLRNAGEIPLVGQESGLVVELHADVVSRQFRVPLDAGALRARLQPVTVLERQVLTLCPEDLLVVLCVHGSKHEWTSLGWVCDVAELLRACPELDWTSVVRHAESTRAARMLHVGVLLAHSLLGASISGPMRSAVEADRAAGRLAAEIGERLLGNPEGAVGFLNGLRYHVRLRDRFLDGVRYCCSMVMVPQPADWAAVRLPPGLRFLYHVYRPLRVVYRQAIRPVGRWLIRLARPSGRESR